MTKFITAKTQMSMGVGHQFSCWNTCYTLAKQYGLTFVHQPFHQPWEDWLGFGKGEVKLSELRPTPVIKVPMLNTDAADGQREFKEWVESAPDGALIYLPENLHQRDHTITELWLQEKYWSHHKKAETWTTLVAVHIRRGDIMQLPEADRDYRLLPNVYFAKIIATLRDKVHDAEVHVYSEGRPEDFADLADVILHLAARDDGRGDIEAFHAMAGADVLVMSKSGFSYLAAILSRRTKIGVPFWHSFPSGVDGWIRATEDGNFDASLLHIV